MVAGAVVQAVIRAVMGAGAATAGMVDLRSGVATAAAATINGTRATTIGRDGTGGGRGRGRAGAGATTGRGRAAAGATTATATGTATGSS